MFQSAARANPPRPVSDVDGSQLQPYFREMASHGVMSAEDEVAAAHTIAAHRPGPARRRDAAARRR